LLSACSSSLFDDVTQQVSSRSQDASFCVIGSFRGVLLGFDIIIDFSEKDVVNAVTGRKGTGSIFAILFSGWSFATEETVCFHLTVLCLNKFSVTILFTCSCD